MSLPVKLVMGIDAACAAWMALVILRAARRRARLGENYDFAGNVGACIGVGALLMLLPWLILLAVRAVARAL